MDLPDRRASARLEAISRQCGHFLPGGCAQGNSKTSRLRTVLQSTTCGQQLEEGMQALQQDYCTFKLGLCSAARLAICSRWSAVTVSPASAIANIRNSFALGSSTRRLGGKAHGAGHASRFRLAWAAAQNLPGTVLRQRPSAEGCSIAGASHLAIPLLFASARESQRQAGVLRLNSTRRAPPEPVDRPSQPASP